MNTAVLPQTSLRQRHAGLWMLLRLALALPWLVLQVVGRRLRGRLPRRWSLVFAVAVEVLRFLVGAMLAPLMTGLKLNLPSPPLRGRLGRTTLQRRGQLAGREVEWLEPKGSGSRRCVLYLHGGAFVTGSIGTHRALMARLAHAADARVVGLDYRLAPEHRYPAGLEDCVAACVALLESGEVKENLIIAGDSAGGGLAISTLLSLRDRGLPLPAAAWLLSPAVDLADERASWQENLPFDYLSPLALHRELFAPTYLGEHGDPLDPLVSPVRADLQGLPPLLIQVGEKEILRDQVVEFARHARTAGVEVELEVAADMIHVYPAFAGLTPQADQAFEQAGEFMRARTSG